MKIFVSVKNEAGESITGATIVRETRDGACIFRNEKSDADIKFEEKGNPYIGKQIRLYAECEGFVTQDKYCKVEADELNVTFKLAQEGQQESSPRIRVDLHPSRLSAKPGLPVTLRVVLTNSAPAEEKVSVSLSGMPSQWLDRSLYDGVRLAPGIAAEVDFLITVPRSAIIHTEDY